MSTHVKCFCLSNHFSITFAFYRITGAPITITDATTLQRDHRMTPLAESSSEPCACWNAVKGAGSAADSASDAVKRSEPRFHSPAVSVNCATRRNEVSVTDVTTPSFHAPGRKPSATAKLKLEREVGAEMRGYWPWPLTPSRTGLSRGRSSDCGR